MTSLMEIDQGAFWLSTPGSDLIGRLVVTSLAAYISSNLASYNASLAMAPLSLGAGTSIHLTVRG
jgi:hypothetical protein